MIYVWYVLGLVYILRTNHDYSTIEWDFPFKIVYGMCVGGGRAV